MTTTKQIEFITKLAIERQNTIATVAPEILSQDMATLSGREASRLIDFLLNLPTDPDPEMPAIVAQAKRRGANKYANPCAACGNEVAVEAGYYFVRPNGKFDTHHKVGECSTPLPAAAAPAYEHGQCFFAKVTGISSEPTPVIQVVRGKQGQWYGKYLTGIVGRGKLSWEYDRGCLKNITGDPLSVTEVMRQACILTWEYEPGSEELRRMAVEYAKAHASCMFCGIPLTDDGDNRSIAVGYGPVCATKYGLPWG